MKRKLKRSHIIILAVVALSLLSFIVMPLILNTDPTDPHAGHNHGSEVTDDHAGHDHGNTDTHASTNTNTNSDHKHVEAHNKAAKDCYKLIKNSNGTYSYTVTARSGHVYEPKNSFKTEPVASVAGSNVLLVSGKLNEDNDISGWAHYYNVTGEGTTSFYENHVLAATTSKIARLEGENGVFRVAVNNPFGPDHATYTELPGLTATDSGNPVLKCKMMEDGDLQVTYTVDGAEKTVVVKMD